MLSWGFAFAFVCFEVEKLEHRVERREKNVWRGIMSLCLCCLHRQLSTVPQNKTNLTYLFLQAHH